MQGWKRIEPTTTTQVGWMTITSKTFQMPDGKIKQFDCVYPDDREFTVCLPVTTEGKIVIARQFRPGPERWFDDFPGGFVDEGETSSQAIERELLEETGYQAANYEYLGYYHKDAYLNGKWHAFIAYDCKKIAEPNLDEGEYIDTVEMSIDEVLASAKRGDSEDNALILMGYDQIQKIKEDYEKTN